MELSCIPCDCILPAGDTGRAETHIVLTAGKTASMSMMPGRHVRLACHEGIAWVTITGGKRDFLLKEGEAVWVRARAISAPRRLFNRVIDALPEGLRDRFAGARIVAQGMPEARLGILEEAGRA